MADRGGNGGRSHAGLMTEYITYIYSTYLAACNNWVNNNDTCINRLWCKNCPAELNRSRKNWSILVNLTPPETFSRRRITHRRKRNNLREKQECISCANKTPRRNHAYGVIKTHYFLECTVVIGFAPGSSNYRPYGTWCTSRAWDSCRAAEGTILIATIFTPLPRASFYFSTVCASQQFGRLL